MLELILPPVVIVAALGALFWIFYKKRGLVSKLNAVQKLSRTVSPPKIAQNDITQDDEDVEETLTKTSKRSRFSVSGGIVGRVRGKVMRVLPKRKRAKVDISSTFGALNDRKEGLKKDRAAEKLRSFREDADGARGRKYASKRPQRMVRSATARRVEMMVREEAAMPGDRSAEEKDQYEQILVERIALNPKDIEAYERLGDYYLEWQSYQDAKECYKQVLRLSPVNRRAKIRMRRIEKILG